MWLILLEAGLALALLLFIVWWTMFHGRPGGERRVPPPADPGAPPADPPSAAGSGAQRATDRDR